MYHDWSKTRWFHFLWSVRRQGRTFFSKGDILYLCCPIWWLFETRAYECLKCDLCNWETEFLRLFHLMKMKHKPLLVASGYCVGWHRFKDHEINTQNEVTGWRQSQSHSEVTLVPFHNSKWTSAVCSNFFSWPASSGGLHEHTHRARS